VRTRVSAPARPGPRRRGACTPPTLAGRWPARTPPRRARRPAWRAPL